MHLLRHQTMRAVCIACAIFSAMAPLCVSAAPAPALVQQQAVTAKAHISAIQQQLSQVMAQYDAAAAKLTKTSEEVAANRRELTRLDRSVKDGTGRLSAEAVFLYRTDGNGFAEALLSAGSLEEFANRLMALSRIASRDAETIQHLRADRLAAEQLGAKLLAREQQEALQVSEVSARRGKAQAALNDQQRYVDSLSTQVAKTLQTQQTASTSGGSTTVTPPSPDAVAWATVEGRSGKYAVLASQQRSYAPTGLTFDGEATWYGNVRPNMRTASGRAFDENDLTCAHKTLPFGTRVAVTFRGKRVIVTVTDRGPYGKGRVIDLTKRAASLIGLKSAGVGHVHCEVVSAK